MNDQFNLRACLIIGWANGQPRETVIASKAKQSQALSGELFRRLSPRNDTIQGIFRHALRQPLLATKPIALCEMRSAVRGLSRLRSPQPAICNPKSAIRKPRSKIGARKRPGRIAQSLRRNSLTTSLPAGFSPVHRSAPIILGCLSLLFSFQPSAFSLSGSSHAGAGD